MTQAHNQSTTITTTTTTNSNENDEEQTNGKDSSGKTNVKLTQQKNQTDENTEPPAKRLRTRAATAALNQ